MADAQDILKTQTGLWQPRRGEQAWMRTVHTRQRTEPTKIPLCCSTGRCHPFPFFYSFVNYTWRRSVLWIGSLFSIYFPCITINDLHLFRTSTCMIKSVLIILALGACFLISRSMGTVGAAQSTPCIETSSRHRCIASTPSLELWPMSTPPYWWSYLDAQAIFLWLFTSLKLIK